MRYSVIFLILAFAFTLVIANPHEHNARRHVEIAKRSAADVGLHKRFSNARFTFYQAGMGACGRRNSGSDFIVALNQPQYGSGADCFKEITITANGKTHGATITDECPSCPEGALDMSEALFTFFAPASVGVIQGSWAFGSGGGDESSSSSKTTHTTHTHTSTTHTTSMSHTKKSSSSSTQTSTYSTSSTTPINYLTGDASGLAMPTGAFGPGGANNLNDFNQAIVCMGALVVAGGKAN